MTLRSWSSNLNHEAAMPWPLPQDYNEAIQNPAQCFDDPELRRGEAVTNALGLPAPCSGTFADVYAVVTGDRKWAVKCFTRQIPGLRERYQHISKYLRQVKLPFMVDFSFLDLGIKIGGAWYPVLKMEWVEGIPLNQFVKDRLDKPGVLGTLGETWVKMARGLREASLAHCDLQHGNVLLVPGKGTKAGSLAVMLVDYDGMCVPALTLLKSIEVGHPAYQHPQRLRERIYSLEVDRFSNLVIYTALRALAVGGKALWDKYDDGDNLLFKQADFQAPSRSRLFAELLRMNDPEVRKLASALIDGARMPLDQAPLLDQLVSVRPGPDSQPPPTPPSTLKEVVPNGPGSGSFTAVGPKTLAKTTASGMAATLIKPAPPSTLVMDRPARARPKSVIALTVAAMLGLFCLALFGTLAFFGSGGNPDESDSVAQGKSDPETEQNKAKPGIDQGKGKPEKGQGNPKPEKGQGQDQAKRKEEPGKAKPGKGEGKAKPGRSEGKAKPGKPKEKKQITKGKTDDQKTAKKFRVARALAADLVDLRTRGQASMDFLSMGSEGETVLHPYLGHKDLFVKIAALDILRVMGTQKSMTAVGKATRDPDANVAFTAKVTLAEMKKRILPDKEQARVNKAVGRGVAYLKRFQENNGRLQDNNGYWTINVDTKALYALTLLECGVPAKDKSIRKAAESLRRVTIDPVLENTYILSLAILFFDRLGDPGDVALIESMAVRLLAGQTKTGCWGATCPGISQEEVRRLTKHVKEHAQRIAKGHLPKKVLRKPQTKRDLPQEIVAQLLRIKPQNGPRSTSWDTQFATLALWVSRRHGLPVDEALERVRHHFQTTQLANGSWGYYMEPKDGDTLVLRKSSRASFTCAGLLCLAVGEGAARARLDPKNPKGKSTNQLEKDKYIRKSLAALANFIGKPGEDFEQDETQHLKSYSFFWDLERVAMIFSFRTLSKKDWYAWGSRFFLANQESDGSWWGADGKIEGTCYALLFLRRSNLAFDLTSTLRSSLPLTGEITVKVGGGDQTKAKTNPDTKKSPPGRRVRYLADMQEFEVKVAERRFAKKGNLGYGEGDVRYARGRITVKGKQSPNGLSMCPESNTFARVKYRLGKTARTFMVSVALNDSAGAPGKPPGVGKIPTPLTFLVLGDGKVLWKSRPVRGRRRVQKCKVNVAWVDVLELRINCPGSGVNAQAVWLEPRVLLK
jgi:hypothetical protein